MAKSKFYCSDVHEFPGFRQVRLEPIKNGLPIQADVPSGAIILHVAPPSALYNMFTPGNDYEADFTPAP